MVYYKLKDEKFNGEIFRKNDEKKIYERFVYGPNKWVESSLFYSYLDENSKVYNQYEEIDEKHIINILSKQIEEYEKLWHEAYILANRMHSGKVDKGGIDYMLHPLYVSKQFDIYDFKIVAILHDIVEDTEITLEDLEKYGFPKKIIIAIDAITKRPGEKYFDYIERVKKNYIAKKVKIEDLKHNLLPERIAKAKEFGDLEKRYRKALKILE